MSYGQINLVVYYIPDGKDTVMNGGHCQGPL